MEGWCQTKEWVNFNLQMKGAGLYSTSILVKVREVIRRDELREAFTSGEEEAGGVER